MRAPMTAMLIMGLALLSGQVLARAPKSPQASQQSQPSQTPEDRKSVV